jgi:hypothetical protein
MLTILMGAFSNPSLKLILQPNSAKQKCLAWNIPTFLLINIGPYIKIPPSSISSLDHSDFYFFLIILGCMTIKKSANSYFTLLQTSVVVPSANTSIINFIDLNMSIIFQHPVPVANPLILAISF